MPLGFDFLAILQDYVKLFLVSVCFCFTKVNAKFGELLVKVHIFKDSSPSDHNFPIVSEIVHSV